MINIKIIAALAVTALLAGCGLTTDHLYDSHAKNSKSFSNCSSVVAGKVTAEPGTTVTSINFGRVWIPSVPSYKDSEQITSSTIARYDSSGNFVIDEVGPNPQAACAGLSNGDTLCSYWTGTPASRANITYNFFYDWHGETSSTFDVAGTGSQFQINQFTNLAYFAAASRSTAGVTATSFANAIRDTNDFLNTYFPTQSPGPINFAMVPLTPQHLNLLNSGTGIYVSSTFFNISNAQFICFGPMAAFPACPNSSNQPGYDFASWVGYAKGISFKAANDLVSQNAPAIVRDHPPADPSSRVSLRFTQNLFDLVDETANVVLCSGTTKDFPICQ